MKCMNELKEKGNRMKIKVILLSACLGGLILGGSGCDWTMGGGTESWSSRWNWVNFSGVYRGLAGGPLVGDFTATAGDAASTRNDSYVVASGDGMRTTFAGTLRNRPVVPGSLTISGPTFALTDDGANRLTGGEGTGTIDYDSGVWSIDLGAAAGPGEPITAGYAYRVGGEDAPPPGSGATRVTINSFTVFQEGETLSITDNNGAVFNGRMGRVSGTGGATREDVDTATIPVGDTITAQFSAKGTSASGLEVEMVGTFTGVVGAGGGGTFFLAGRRINGTWIESGGRTGDINGQTGNIQIVIPDAPPEEPAD